MTLYVENLKESTHKKPTRMSLTRSQDKRSINKHQLDFYKPAMNNLKTKLRKTFHSQ